jgi:DNA primase
MNADRKAWIERARAVPIEAEIARRGIQLKRVSAVERAGPCPLCGGTDRFSISTREQLWNCRGCGKGGDVIAMVQHIDGSDFERAVTTLAGEPPRNEPPRRSKGHAGTWIYRNADGGPYLKVERFDKPDGSKGYPQSHWDGTRWVSGKAMGPKIPYRLPELLDSDRTERAYICEGEKCADAVAGLGLTATSASEGAGKWTRDLNKWFQDRLVCILPDNDPPGAKHAEKVAGNLVGIAGEVRIVALPDLGDGDDVFDWIARGGTREQLEAIGAAAPLWEGDADATGDEAAEIQRLTKLAPLEYARERKPAAQRLGWMRWSKPSVVQGTTPKDRAGQSNFR